MEGDKPTVGSDEMLRKLKPRLIDMMIGEPDFLLTHSDSLGLLTREEYTNIKSIQKPSEKLRDIFDTVIGKGSSESNTLLRRMQEEEFQETFPKLQFLKTIHIGTTTTEKCGTKRPQPMPTEEPLLKQTCTNTVVSEKQLMRVAGKMGRHWKQFGRMALIIKTTKLEQIVDDNPNNVVEQVFAMLRVWKMRERSDATPKRLHTLLSEGDWALDPEDIDFLLNDS